MNDYNRNRDDDPVVSHRVWRMTAHHTLEKRNEAATIYRNVGFLALGWGDVGDLRAIQPSSSERIKAIIKHIPEYISSHNVGKALSAFLNEVKNGDLVILTNHDRRFMVMEITGNYQWIAEHHPILGEYQHQREAVERTGIDIESLWNISGGFENGYDWHCPLIPCKNRVII
jgi:predicted Mrr-cat superfamily restriction endonuclease